MIRKGKKATNQLRLAEHQQARGIALTRVERDTLIRSAKDVVVTPVAGQDDIYDIRPGSNIGVVTAGERQIIIRPKIGFERAMFLVSYAIGRGRWFDDVTRLAKADLIIEAVAIAFARHLRIALGRGVLRGYRRYEDSLHTVRGRVRFDDQLRVRLGLAPPIEVAFDEFTEDIEENRILRAALDRLRRFRMRSRLPARQLRPHEVALTDVQLVPYESRALPEINFTRVNEHYRDAIALAKLILEGTSYELEGGDVRATAFLIDMNKVFEDFVVIALREVLGLTETEFPQGARRRHVHLDRRARVRLQPDLSWWDSATCDFVGDVKYKRTTVEGIENADLYQLLAYTIALQLPCGLLVYGAGIETPVTHEVLQAGKRLLVRTLDVAQDPETILENVRELAAEVRRLRITNRADRRATVAAA
jgi:5-methylcytosine-specific restriction enzyme subunit McrC